MWKATARRSVKKPAFICGTVLVVSSIVNFSLALACQNGTLAGVDDCVAESGVFLRISVPSMFVGIFCMWLTQHVYKEQDDFDAVRKTNVDKQQYIVVIMELTSPFWLWGVACLENGPRAYHTCGPAGIWGGLVLTFTCSFIMGWGTGILIKWTGGPCGVVTSCGKGCDEIVAGASFLAIMPVCTCIFHLRSERRGACQIRGRRR